MILRVCSSRGSHWVKKRVLRKSDRSGFHHSQFSSSGRGASGRSDALFVGAIATHVGAVGGLVAEAAADGVAGVVGAQSTVAGACAAAVAGGTTNPRLAGTVNAHTAVGGALRRVRALLTAASSAEAIDALAASIRSRAFRVGRALRLAFLGGRAHSLLALAAAVRAVLVGEALSAALAHALAADAGGTSTGALAGVGASRTAVPLLACTVNA